MTYDLIAAYKDILKNDKVVLDSYKLDSGYYYLLKKDGELKKLIINRDEGDDYELYKYLLVRDLYSKYINSNKAIDTIYTEIINNKKYSMQRRICSNNIYTVFFKNKFLQGLCKENDNKEAVPTEIFIKGIEKYYESLEKLGTEKKEKMLLNESYTKEEIVKNKERMIKAFKQVYEDFKNEEKPKETWIKIFLEEDEAEYIRVANFYLIIKLFNTNDNNVELDKEVYGTNNYNFGMNSKKPYLELKSTSYKIGSLVSREDIIILNNLYKWLYSNGLQTNILKLPSNYDFKGKTQEIKNENLYIIRVEGNNGVARVDDFQYISNYTDNIRPFIVKDILRKKQDDFKAEKIYGLEFYTSNVWIANKKSEKNFLHDSYYDYEKKISKYIGIPNWKKEFLKENSDLFLELFQKENEKPFIKNLNKIGTQIIKNTLIDDLNNNKNYLQNSINCMNLWIAYKKYFKKEGEVDEEMKVNNIHEECKQIMQNNEEIKTDEQYYYLAGQVAFYLLNQSKASKLTQDVTEPFLSASNIKRLKDELRYLYQKYSYDIYLNNPKFNNILSQLLLQEPETNVKANNDLILAGILANNIFYTKKEIDNGGNEDGENE